MHLTIARVELDLSAPSIFRVTTLWLVARRPEFLSLRMGLLLAQALGSARSRYYLIGKETTILEPEGTGSRKALVSEAQSSLWCLSGKYVAKVLQEIYR